MFNLDVLDAKYIFNFFQLISRAAKTINSFLATYIPFGHLILPLLRLILVVTLFLSILSFFLIKHLYYNQVFTICTKLPFNIIFPNYISITPETDQFSGQTNLYGLKYKSSIISIFIFVASNYISLYSKRTTHLTHIEPILSYLT